METINTLMPIIMGVVIAPLVQWLKKYVDIEPRWITAALAVAAVLLMAWGFGMNIQPENVGEYIQIGLSFVGSATLAHAVGRRKFRSTP